MSSFKSKKKQGFLARLRSDASGNIIPLAAAAVIPVMALVGGGVDLSRSYMVRARLQQACDAGVLAGRRAIDNTGYRSQAQQGQGVAVSTAETRATAMFNTNFPSGFQQSSATTFNSWSNDGGITVTGEASTTVPNTIMKFFGNRQTAVQADCGARMEVGNADVAFILDTTGSMGCENDDSETQCGNWFDSGAANTGWVTSHGSLAHEAGASAGNNVSRMNALRGAIMSFDTVVRDAATVGTPRIRYAFVPYAMSVNAGNVIVGVNRNYIVGGAAGESHNYRTSGGLTSRAVSAYVNTLPALNGGTAGSIQNPVLSAGNMTSWAGCVEEPNTVQDSSFVFDGTQNRITPLAANDLNINLVPGTTGSSTRWRPYWGDIHYSGGSLRQSNCPSAARGLAVMSAAEVQTYVNGLTPGGATYHDIGAIWGARLMSPNGLWAANVNAAPPNGRPVGRHIIFMTDGQATSNASGYTAYGVQGTEKRIAASDTNALSRHRGRFAAICNFMRAQGNGGTRIWVILFGTTSSTQLTACASPNSLYTASNANDLNNVFIQIAQTISDLRLSQ